MTKLYIVRHGFSDGNLAHFFTGCTDVDLCGQGFEQAEKLAEYMKNIHVDCVYSSDLQRVVHTIEPTAREKGLKITTDPRLREINGGLWEGLDYEKIGDRNREALDVWLNDIDNAVCTGGEAVRELKTRVWEALCDIARANEGKSVLIATHATPIRAIVSIVTDTKMRDLEWVPNASVTEIVADGENFETVRIGDNEYLGGLKTGFIGRI